MCSEEELQTIMKTFVADCRSLLVDRLSDVRLYGSYARGDQNDCSDIDVMILLDMDRVEARKHLGQICEIAFEVDAGHGVIISPLVRSKHDYERLKKLPGLYSNIMREGVSIIA
jgi:predicted nucleotidyltransferase